MGTIFSILLSFTELLAALWFYDSFLPRRAKPPLPLWVQLALWEGATQLLFWSQRFAPGYEFWWKLAGGTLLHLLFLWGNYQGPAWQKLLLRFAIYGAGYAIDLFIMSATMRLFGLSYDGLVSAEAIYLFSGFTAKTLLLTGAYLLKRFGKWAQRGSSVLPAYTGLFILIVPLFSIVSVVPLIVSILHDGSTSFWVLAEAAALLLCNIAYIVLWDKLEQEARLKNEYQVMRQQVANNMEKLQALKTAYSKQRTLTHDFRNHMRTVQGLIQNNQYEEAAHYAASWFENAPGQTLIVNTNHPILDVLLSQKYEEAKRRGVAVTFSVGDLAKASLPAEDLVTLLSNLLDNAIEAAAQCDTEKLVSVALSLDANGALLLSIRNTSTSVSVEHLSTTKSDGLSHGYGLKNVRRILQKHDGIESVSYADGWFQFTAFLPAGV